VAGFIPLILIFGLMYVLMIRPQQRKVKEQQALVLSISAGDEVVLNSGIFGVVKEVDGGDENVLWIEVYSGVELKVLRSAVDRRFNEATAVDEELVAEEPVTEEPGAEEPGDEARSEEAGSDEA
jgi:preprotein translocase subunit YajC